MEAFEAIGALIVLATTVWVGADASQRDWSQDRFANATWKWVLGCLLLWIVVFPVYLVRRGRVGAVHAPSARPAVRVRERKPGVFWWGIGSCAAMALGAFGPWAHVLGLSVSGTDGSNDGWIVVALAVLALLCVLGQHRNRALIVVGMLAGVGGVATTLYDRHHVTSAIPEAGAFGAVVSVGWGLNLALAASASVVLQALIAAQSKTEFTAVHRAPAVDPLNPLNLVMQTARPDIGAATPPASADRETLAVPAAGWYVDPDDDQRLRYWTGEAWAQSTAQLNPSS